MKINPLISELLGAHIGDGTLYKTSWSLVWELRGGLNEKEYYFDTVCPLLKKIFGLEIISKFRSGGSNGCWGVQTSNKTITNFFLDFGFKPGRKTYSVAVPSFIFDSGVGVKRAFVRGLFDTDGCLRFDRINGSNLKTYPRLEFGFASKDLRDSLSCLLKSLGFKLFNWNDKKYHKLCVSGNKMLKKWVLEISPNNPKHLKKYSLWKKYGFYEPKNATVA